MVSSDEDRGEISPQIVPFPVSVRSTRRRRSRLSRPLSPPSTCEESAHYPIFNPEDPRHNPALGRVALERADTLPQTAQAAGSIRWMHGLPGRSLRRARSGLQALRSGLHRRPSRSADDDHAINGMWSSSDSAEGSSDPRERFFSSTVSEASTEEDYDFGTGLYRTGCNSPRPKNIGSKDLSALTHPLDSAPSLGLQSRVNMPLLFPMDTITSAPTDNGSPTAENSLLIDKSPTIENWNATKKSPTIERSPVTDRSTTTGAFGSTGKSPTVEVGSISTVSNMPSPSDVPVSGFEDQFKLDSISPSQSSTSNMAHQPLLPELPNRNSSLLDTSSVAAYMSEPDQSPSADTKSPLTPVDETTTSCPRTPPAPLQSSQIEQAPYCETEIVVRTEETCSTAEMQPDDHQTEYVAEDTKPMSVVKKPSLNLNNALPEVELGGLAGMEHYLSVNTGGASEESKTSDEEPSPDSLIDNDRHAPLSPWLPTDKGDRTSLLSLRDEYFLVDGKSTDLRPDRGDNPIKGERVFAGDGGLHSGPGLDRDLSIRTQEIPEIIGPGGPIGVPSPRSFPREREGSDSTEEYLVTYSLLHRHYFS
ncbi:hypothetical protein BDV19DRAFT_182801 [Aspergillus venezuelensis]